MAAIQGALQTKILVCARLRPIIQEDFKLGALNKSTPEICVHLKRDGQTIKLTKDLYDVKLFRVDHTFNEVVTQDQVFGTAFGKIVNDSFAGFNGTILAYGQTGSGKTFTMFGNENQDGIVQLSLSVIFETVKRRIESELVSNVSISFYQLYLEQAHDLLADRQAGSRTECSPLAIRENTSKGAYVENLLRVSAEDESTARAILKRGLRNRITQSTQYNMSSSRSHAIFQVFLDFEDETLGVERTKRESANRKSCNVRQRVLTFVDLAGSERVQQHHKEKSKAQFKESVAINKSISALGNCIQALANDSMAAGESADSFSRSSHVPFRDCKLTWLLAEPLGGNSKTCIIVNIGPCFYNFEETRSTLKFAERAIAIKKVVRKCDVEQLQVENIRSAVLDGKGKLMIAGLNSSGGRQKKPFHPSLGLRKPISMKTTQVLLRKGEESRGGESELDDEREGRPEAAEATFQQPNLRRPLPSGVRTSAGSTTTVPRTGNGEYASGSVALPLYSHEEPESDTMFIETRWEEVSYFESVANSPLPMSVSQQQQLASARSSTRSMGNNLQSMNSAPYGLLLGHRDGVNPPQTNHFTEAQPTGEYVLHLPRASLANTQELIEKQPTFGWNDGYGGALMAPVSTSAVVKMNLGEFLRSCQRNADKILNWNGYDAASSLTAEGGPIADEYGPASHFYMSASSNFMGSLSQDSSGGAGIRERGLSVNPYVNEMEELMMYAADGEGRQEETYNDKWVGDNDNYREVEEECDEEESADSAPESTGNAFVEETKRLHLPSFPSFRRTFTDMPLLSTDTAAKADSTGQTPFSPKRSPLSAVTPATGRGEETTAPCSADDHTPLKTRSASVKDLAQQFSGGKKPLRLETTPVVPPALNVLDAIQNKVVSKLEQSQAAWYDAKDLNEVASPPASTLASTTSPHNQPTQGSTSTTPVSARKYGFQRGEGEAQYHIEKVTPYDKRGNGRLDKQLVVVSKNEEYGVEPIHAPPPPQPHEPLPATPEEYLLQRQRRVRQYLRHTPSAGITPGDKAVAAAARLKISSFDEVETPEFTTYDPDRL